MNIKMGAIIEIPTSKGLAYAQYTHKDTDFGALIRVIDGLYPSTPKDLDALVNQPHRFYIFFPLGGAVRRKIFKIIGNRPVPEFAQKFPIFKTNKTSGWSLWNGEKSWMVDHLSQEARNYPIRSIWNDTLLIQRIEENWRPCDDR